MIRGPVAESVSDMLDNSERPFGKSSFWDYPWPRPDWTAAPHA